MALHYFLLFMALSNILPFTLQVPNTFITTLNMHMELLVITATNLIASISPFKRNILTWALFFNLHPEIPMQLTHSSITLISAVCQIIEGCSSRTYFSYRNCQHAEQSPTSVVSWKCIFAASSPCSAGQDTEYAYQAIGNNGEARVVDLDISKAFNSVWYDAGLLSCIDSVQIKLFWVKNYYPTSNSFPGDGSLQDSRVLFAVST